MHLLENMSTFPLACPLCKKDMSMHDVHNLLDEGEFKKLLYFASKNFILQRPKELDMCPSNDCMGIIPLRVEEQKSDEDPSLMRFFCHSCKEDICTRCRTRYHQNLTCEQQCKISAADKEFNDYILRGDPSIRRCPNCNVVIQKKNGCNHVICRICKIHICWFQGCMKTFSQEKECYDHMSNIHGDFHDNEDRNQEPEGFEMNWGEESDDDEPEQINWELLLEVVRHMRRNR
eukprot:TRINITY_DN3249_c0_g1_i11.p1 TRINITY_DN3249_c0_g1~~TRINITY_DN3249_c0_g1_i11.p1  ORF type:complete len:232 (-),score=29.22 TRINITY_DN3249_c0_g1_i11:83-778(-)